MDASLHGKVTPTFHNIPLGLADNNFVLLERAGSEASLQSDLEPDAFHLVVHRVSPELEELCILCTCKVKWSGGTPKIWSRDFRTGSSFDSKSGFAAFLVFIILKWLLELCQAGTLDTRAIQDVLDVSFIL